MVTHKLIENVFFFGLLAASAFLMWKLFVPFFGPLALAAIVVTVAYPLYDSIRSRIYKKNTTLAALLATISVIFIVVLPLAILGSFLLRETVSIYSLLNTASYASFSDSLHAVEGSVQLLIPEFSLDIAPMISQIASFFATHLLSIFAGTASTIFYFFLMLIASFYFFRDGKAITHYLITLSPLKDGEDGLILDRLALSVRSVALGTVLVALIQGGLTSLGLWLFGFEHAVLWGSVAAIGALVPGVGTTIVFIPAVIYLAATGSALQAAGVAVWGIIAVGFIDNLLGPYLMSRGNPLHPFVILLSVLGGIALFGPIGFVLGPVIASLFTVLVELYAAYLKASK